MARKSDKKVPDNDPTDELPVLSEEVIVASGDEIPALDDARIEDPGPRKVEFRAVVEPRQAAVGDGAGPHGATGQTETIQALERDVAELAARWSKLEQYFAEHEGAIGTLKDDLASSRQELEVSQVEQRELRIAVQQKDAELAALRNSLEDERGDAEQSRTRLEETKARAAALDAALGTAQAELQTAREELETTRQELDASLQRAAEAKSGDERLRPYLEEIESLKAYIAGRGSRWEEMEVLVAAQKERIAELETETSQRVSRQDQLEQMLHEEGGRADALKAKVGELSGLLDARERALNELTVAAGLTEAAAAPPAVDDEVTAVDRDPTGRERLGKLQSTLAEQRSLLEDRELQLAAANEDREQLREQLTETQSDLDHTRNDLNQLEQKLVEREYSVDEQEQRIATLQGELAERLTALRDMQQAVSAANEDEAGETARQAQLPVLVCLTSDQPERHVLDKPEMTIGRSSSCDVQILTHFVSREHAALRQENGGVFIEDRGSTNGVFVNSVRVERQELKDGDWVTIGETQFRYLSGGST